MPCWRPSDNGGPVCHFDRYALDSRGGRIVHLLRRRGGLSAHGARVQLESRDIRGADDRSRGDWLEAKSSLSRNPRVLLGYLTAGLRDLCRHRRARLALYYLGLSSWHRPGRNTRGAAGGLAGHRSDRCGGAPVLDGCKRGARAMDERRIPVERTAKRGGARPRRSSRSIVAACASPRRADRWTGPGSNRIPHRTRTSI